MQFIVAFDLISFYSSYPKFFISISTESVQPIAWATRMNIAVGVARGLAFLHGLDANVIYRDLKASNILLDSVRSTVKLALWHWKG